MLELIIITAHVLLFIVVLTVTKWSDLHVYSNREETEKDCSNNLLLEYFQGFRVDYILMGFHTDESSRLLSSLLILMWMISATSNPVALSPFDTSLDCGTVPFPHMHYFLHHNLYSHVKHVQLLRNLMLCLRQQWTVRSLAVLRECRHNITSPETMLLYRRSSWKSPVLWETGASNRNAVEMSATTGRAIVLVTLCYLCCLPVVARKDEGRYRYVVDSTIFSR